MQCSIITSLSKRQRRGVGGRTERERKKKREKERVRKCVLICNKQIIERKKKWKLKSESVCV